MQSLKSNFLILIAISLVFSSCRDKAFQTKTVNIALTLTKSEWRNQTFSLENPRDLNNPGKIYVKDNYLFINERLQGIHIFDNSNPASPFPIGFLPIHANVDIAIRDGILYADSYYDLLSFDISNPASPFYLQREEDVFDFYNYYELEGFSEQHSIQHFDSDQIVISWTQEEITEEVTSGGYYGCYDLAYTMEASFAGDASVQSNISGGAGLGGSMARFTSFGNNLYILKDWELKTFDISNNSLSETNSISLDRQSETIFPSENHLFIGTTTGMLIYDISNPSAPSFVSMYDHLQACDPVYVKGNRAYVTLSSGNGCWNAQNQLEVIDISNLANPEVLAIYPMTNPKGLAVQMNKLYLCDKGDGLKVFDVTDDHNIDNNLEAFFGGIDAFDVIPSNSSLILTGESGIFQYNYSDPNNIFQISHIAVTP